MGKGRRWPIYVFEEGGTGGLKETLEEAVGNRDAGRWRVLLEACR